MATFLKSLDEFEKAFGQYVDMFSNIGKYRFMLDLDNKLRSLGWNDNEILNYENIAMDLEDFKVKVLDVVLEVIAHKYGVFLIKFDPNPMAKAFLQQVIGSKITDYMFRKIEIFANDLYKNLNKDDEKVRIF